MNANRADKLRPRPAPSHKDSSLVTPSLEAKAKEIVLHELGEAFVVSVISIQRELRRYQEDNGAFIIDDLEIELPVKLRIDTLGQTMAEVVNEMPSNGSLTRIKLRIRPDPQPFTRIPVFADQPLATLKILSNTQISYLESHRIFSVEDLIRASRRVPMRKALEVTIPASVLKNALERGEVLLIPVMPMRVAMSLLEVGVSSIKDFLSRDPSKLALLLAQKLDEEISKDLVSQWQKKLKKLQLLVNLNVDELRRDEVDNAAKRADIKNV